MEEPRTVEELCDYIVKYSDVIFVREQIGWVWGSYSLKELPGDVAIKHALRFIKEQVIPVRLPREAEQSSPHK